MPGEICQLSEFDRKHLLSNELYHRAVANEYDHYAIGDILAHFSFEWPNYSDDVALFIVNR